MDFTRKKYWIIIRNPQSQYTSSWEEPFGRSSLEAASRGNAIILSKRGVFLKLLIFLFF